MRALLGAFLLTLGLSGPSWATVTCTTTDFTANSGSTDPATVSETIPNNSNQITFLAALDRSESEADPPVSDDQAGVWTKRDGPLNSTATTARVWLYERTAGTKGNLTNISVDWSTAINWVVVVGTCVSDSANALTYVSSAALQDHSAVQPWTSNTQTFTAAGVLIGYTGQNSNSSPNTPGTNQTEHNTATLRQHVYTRPESTGTHGFDVTMSGPISGVFGASLYQEASAAPSVNFFRCRLQVCP